jgi:hypothetical protein
MQRLNHHQDRERGAVAVIVALLMVPLIGFAAISIDIAAMHAERQQLQTGADAAALAIAQDCAREACGDINQAAQTAQDLAVPNSNDADPRATLTAFDKTAGRVTVHNEGTSDHWFAPVLGYDSTQVSAESTARWGYPTGGTSLPLAISFCEWWNQTSGGIPSTTTPRTIHLAGTSNLCQGPSGNVPGGFGWLKTDGNSCRLTTSITHTYGSDTGMSVSNGCKSQDFVSVRNATVLLPIFDERTQGQGTNAEYRVYGYAAFKITGYDFPGITWNASHPSSPSCSKCIIGYFTQFVDLTDAFNYSPTGPKLGAAVVALTG